MGHQRDLALSARSFLRPTTQRRIPLNPDLGYWGGVTWVYAAEVTNGPAGGSADIEVAVTPGEGNEFELQSMMARKVGATSVICVFQIEDDAGTQLDGLYVLLALASNAVAWWPQIHQAAGTSPAGDQGSGLGRRIVSGDMILRFDLRLVPINQGAEVGCVARVRGDKPTVTFTGNPGATIDVTTDKFF